MHLTYMVHKLRQEDKMCVWQEDHVEWAGLGNQEEDRVTHTDKPAE